MLATSEDVAMGNDLLARHLMSAMLVLTLACGDSDEPAPAEGGTGGSDETGGTGGGGGTSGSATGGTTSNTDGGITTTGMDFTCGATQCMTPDISEGTGVDLSMLPLDITGLIGVTGCCTPDDNACGIEQSSLFSGCLAQDMPSEPEDACPTVEFVYDVVQIGMSFNGMAPPCCNTEVGECGLDLSRVNLDPGPLLTPILGLSGPVDLNLGAGCVPATLANTIRGDAIRFVTEIGSEPISCGNLDDAGI
jgi:hypothetical protein